MPVSSVRERSRQNSQERRSQIIDAAIKLIGRHGYQGLTVRALAQSCGLTNGGLLHHIGSKEQLLVTVLEERDQRESLAVPQLLGAYSVDDADPVKRIVATFRAIVGRSVTQPELMRLFIVLQAEALDPAHPAYDFFLRREADVLSRFETMFSPHMSSPRTVARQTLALLDGLYQQWLRADCGFDLVALWDATMPTILERMMASARSCETQN